MAAADRPENGRRQTAWVRERLRDAILEGRLEPGSPLSHGQVGRELGVSRTPVREAVRLLQHEGLVVAEVDQRTRVAELSAEDLDGLCAMRIGLEGLAVTLTVPQLTAGDLEALDACLDTLEAAVLKADLATAHDAHRAFHLALCAGAPERLRGTVADLWDHAERYRRAYALTDDAAARFARAQADHRAILAAARAGDAALAAERLAGHLAETALRVLEARFPATAPRAIRAALGGRGR